MKNIFWLLVVLVFSTSFVLADVPAPVNSAPPMIDLKSFPILRSGELTAGKAAELGLIPARLGNSVMVLNHYRVDNSWRLQNLRPGDLVYKDQKTGSLRYRAQCANRIEEYRGCWTCHREATVSPAGSDEGKMNSLLSGLGDKIAKGLKFLWDNLGWLVVLLATIVLLLFLWDKFREWKGSNSFGPWWSSGSYGPRPGPPNPIPPARMPVMEESKKTSVPADSGAGVQPTSTSAPAPTPVTPTVDPTSTSAAASATTSASTPATPSGATRSISFSEEEGGKPFMVQAKGLRLVGYEESEGGTTTIRFRRT